MKRFLLVAATVLALSAPTLTATANPAGPGTDISGGVLLQDTIWQKSGSPYRVHGTVEIPAGVSLRIRAGVRVLAQDSISRMFLVQGELRALSDPDHLPITIDGGGTASLFSTEGAGTASYIRIQNGALRNAVAILTFDQTYAKIDLFDSTVTGMSASSYLVQPGRSRISRNVFEDSAGWSVQRGGPLVLFENNRFVGQSTQGFAWIRCSSTTNHPVQVHRNTFAPAGIFAVELTRDNDSAAIDATSNYWSTISPSTISGMILDVNDDFYRYGAIPYEPYLSAPAPDTP